MTDSTAPLSRRLRAPGLVRYAVAPLALLVSSALVWQASNAAFSADTTNGTNSWASGTVEISDDDSGSAMFNASGLASGDSGQMCIAVAYTGSLAAEVRLHGAGTGALAPYLALRVEEGTGGSTGGCGSFVPTGTVYTGTLDDFVTQHSSYGTGVGSWTVANPPATRSYRFSYELTGSTAAQGKTADAVFTWEAQNS